MPASARIHRPDGPKADHAPTIKLDHSSGADHSDLGFSLGIKSSQCISPRRSRSLIAGSWEIAIHFAILFALRDILSYYISDTCATIVFEMDDFVSAT